MTAGTGDISLHFKTKQSKLQGRMASVLIQPESAPNREQTFRFYLPLVSQDDKANAWHRQPSINVSEPGEVQKVLS